MLFLVIVRLVEDRGGIRGDVTFWNERNQAESWPTKSGVMKDSAEVKHESTAWLFRDALTFSDVLIGLTFFKVSRKSMTESGGLPEVQLESTVSFSRFSPDILRAQNGLMLSLALIFSDVLIGKDLLKQSLLTFFRVNRESRRNRTNEIRRSERSCRGQAWKHRVAFSRFTLDLHVGQHCAYQLLSSTLTFTDVLIGIDLVTGKMWPSETITFWLSSQLIENRTESGGMYQRNQAFRLTTACGFFEMPWPSQMSIRTHRFILSVDVIWCLIGTDFVRGKMCLSNLQLIHSHLFSSTSYWAFPPAQHVEKNMFCHICILFVKCSSDTREDACNYTTDWCNFSIDMGF